MGDEGVVRRLIETVRDLSDQMESHSNNNAEISRVFGRRNHPHDTRSMAEVSLAQTASTSSTATTSRFRRLTNMRRIGSNVARKTRAASNAPFLCDLILLGGPGCNNVPRQGPKLFLLEQGHVLSACQFNKGMNAIQVETTILQAFGEKIPIHVDIEILMSAHNKLVKPTLAPGQLGINGVILHRLFRNKPVYIRPNQQLLAQDYEEAEIEEKNFQTVNEEISSLENGSEAREARNGRAGNEVENRNDNPVTTNLNSSQAQALSDAIQPMQFNTIQDTIDVDAMHCDIPSSPAEDDTSDATLASMLAVKEIAINRNNVLKDMIREFQDDNVLVNSLEVVFIDFRGEIEAGRGSGVLREALSIFWKEFFSALSCGANEKVPSIRHDYQKEEWQSVARILVVGFEKEKYFPLNLSKAFIAACLFGEEALPKKWLLESFFQYVSRDERKTLTKSMTDECDPCDEEVLEVLSSYNCKSRVSKENMEKIIEELAHQEIIQHPKYVASVWAPIVARLKCFKEFNCISSLSSVYELKRPSAKKIVNLFSVVTKNENERECLAHLKRFVKSLDESMLGVFLQFITGSNVISVDKIAVGFSEEDGATRRPMAHTCAPLLILPSTYNSYNQLSEEFSSLLREASAWAFNVI